MMKSPRIYTNLTTAQYDRLRSLADSQDRSVSYLISKAVTNHLSDAVPFTGSADIKRFARTTPENVEAINKAATARECDMWRLINGAVQRMLDGE